MKKILFFLVILTYSVSYADSIPGFIDVRGWMEINQKLGYSLSYNTSNIEIKYGVEHNYFQPYLFGKFQAVNYANSDLQCVINYNYGAGIKFFKYFFIEAAYNYSGDVYSRSRNSDGYSINTLSSQEQNIYRAGIEFSIK